MSKIYSRPRIRLPKFLITNVGKGSNPNKQKSLKILFIIIIAIITVKISLDAVLPIFESLCEDKAKSIALPMLLCSEEDVEGNHSSSAGKVGEKELFYIMSRGFNFKEAMKLMVRAKFNKILENIKDENLKQEILDEINTKLD